MTALVPRALRSALPSGVRLLVGELAAAADELGVPLGLVGGPVRDWLLGRGIRDVDLVVQPPPGRKRPGPLELARSVRKADDRIVSHDRFGTVRIEREGERVDLATVRSERYAHPGALPEIAAGTLQQDLERRDFTVNALLVPLGMTARRTWSSTLDASPGRKDLDARVLRVFHPRSFHDDPTRALRAARLATRLGFRLARSSRTALRDAIRDGAFGAVSGERYRAELEKLFEEASCGGDPVAALRWLSEAHVLAALEPGLQLTADAAASLRRWVRGGSPGGTPWLVGFTLWFAPLPAGVRRRSLARFGVTGAPAEHVQGFPQRRARWVRELGRARGRGALDAVLHPMSPLDVAALAASVDAPLRRKIERHRREDRDVVLPIDGDDLREIGLEGAAIGRALAAVRAAVLDRRVRSRTDALALAREIARPLRSKGGKRAPR